MHSTFLAIMLACWVAFGLAWLAGWVYNLVRGPGVRRRSFSVPLWAVALVVLVAFLAKGSGFHFLRPAGAVPPWVQAPGAALLVLATLFTLWARLALGRMWSSLPEAKAEHELRTDGPYGITRHPIYTGMLGMLLASLLVGGIGQWAALAVLGAVVVLFKIPAEERIMLDTFGDRYRQYRQRVPALIPGIRWPGRAV